MPRAMGAMTRRAMCVVMIYVVVVGLDVMEPGPVMRRRDGGGGS
jgi:hypothetical protein